MALREQSAFGLRYSVSTTIDAPPTIVWAALTDADRHNAWNTTVTELVGPIALGRRLTITVPIAPGRTFRPRVAVFEAPSRMVWQDGTPGVFRGVRTFTLEPAGAGTRFTMTEAFTGFAVPMARGSLPDFAPVFDQYAADLKAAAEDR